MERAFILCVERGVHCDVLRSRVISGLPAFECHSMASFNSCETVMCITNVPGALGPNARQEFLFFS